MKSVKIRGFSLIEIIIVMAIIFSLIGFMSLNLSGSTNAAKSSTALYTFIADFKNQQTKSMTGDTEGRGIPDTYSIYIGASSYTLFHGANYNPADSTNFVVATPVDYQITSTFPNSKIVFASQSGEIIPFSQSNNTVTVRNTQTGAQKVIQINKYGIITGIN